MRNEGPDLRQQPGPHVFVDDLEALEIATDDRHHLARVLRLRDGDHLTASNSRGSWRSIVFGATVEAAGPVHDVQPPDYDLGLGIALTKAAKPEFAVQKATELGIDEIVVFPATHSVVRWDADKRAKNEGRLQRVAREAAMQSRRVTIPTVQIVATAADVLGRTGVVRADFGGNPMTSDHRFVVVGPEGGWAPDEIAVAADTVDLGPTVLRAETAALVAASQMARLRLP